MYTSKYGYVDETHRNDNTIINSEIGNFNAIIQRYNAVTEENQEKTLLLEIPIMSIEFLQIEFGFLEKPLLIHLIHLIQVDLENTVHYGTI